MKRLLSFLAALCAVGIVALAPVPALAVPAVVQAVTANRLNNTAQTFSGPNMTTTAGNAIVVYASEYQPDTSFDATTPVTDGAGNTYVAALTENADTVSKIKLIVYYCLNCAALSAQPITLHMASATNNIVSFVATEVSGLPASGSLDLVQDFHHPTTTSYSFTTTGTTAQASEIAFSDISSDNGGSGAITEASGWVTQGDTYNISNATALHVATKILSSTQQVTYNPSIALTGPANMATVTFKASGAAPPKPVCTLGTIGAGTC
jgi:hypothetical protein